ncbi:unnamed protein product, partial [Symbiodinium necroappetens]
FVSPCVSSWAFPSPARREQVPLRHVRLATGGETLQAAEAAGLGALLLLMVRRISLRRRHRRHQDLLEVVLRGISAWLRPAGREALDLRPLGSFGAEVRGLDLSSPDLPSGQLRALLWEHGLLLFRDQDLLEE